MPDEADVRELIALAVKENKTVYLPKVSGGDLELRRYEGENSLEKGAFGILEPTGEQLSDTDFSKIDLAIIPGMAFDKAGNRLGRGKGFYDKLLKNMPRTYKIGVCFPFQFLDSLPAEDHDIKTDTIIYD